MEITHIFQRKRKRTAARHQGYENWHWGDSGEDESPSETRRNHLRYFLSRSRRRQAICARVWAPAQHPPAHRPRDIPTFKYDKLRENWARQLSFMRVWEKSMRLLLFFLSFNVQTFILFFYFFVCKFRAFLEAQKGTHHTQYIITRKT